INPSVAKLVEAADARNSGDSQTVSLHIGWLVALSSAPGEGAMKKPAAQPMVWRIRCGQRSCNQRPGQRWGRTAARKEAKAQAPNRVRPQEPADIGDQYLKAGA